MIENKRGGNEEEKVKEKKRECFLLEVTKENKRQKYI
jgi:hypothetical protein